MNSVEAVGKNIEQAIENALFELKASREDVDIKIISQGGFLKKARVLVTISPDAVDKYKKREELKQKELENSTSEVYETKVTENIEGYKVESSKKTEVKKSQNSIQIVTDEEYVVESVEDENEEDENEVIAKRDPREVLEGILNQLNIDAQIELFEDDKTKKYSITGDNLSCLIGAHGKTLTALNFYVAALSQKRGDKHVVIDINNYRQKRTESLIAMAKKTADKVAKTGRYHKFPCMEAYERKVIHTALQNDSRVTTMSKGTDPSRYVMVFPVVNERDR